MAKLLSYYNLCPTNIGKEFLGLAPDAEQGSIINTLGRNMVIIIKLSNQKQVSSWTVLDRLTTKVIYDFKSKKYVGIFLKRYMRQWDEVCTDINKIKKIKFHKSIHDIFSLEQHNNTVILYDDGNCESLENAIQTRKSSEKLIEIVQEGESISNVAFFTISNSIVITYFVTNSKNEIEFLYYLLDSKSLRPLGNIIRVKIERPEQHVKLCGYTVIEGSFWPSMVTIWSDQRIFMLQLGNFSNLNENNIGHFISMLTNVKLDRPISIARIGKDYFAIYGASSGQEGAFLSIFNIKFRIIQTQQFFKIYFNNSRLWVIGNNIFLGLEQMLSVVPFRISKEQLLDMIGTQKNKGSTDYVEREYINEEYDLEQSLSFDASFKIDSIEDETGDGNKNKKKHDGFLLRHETALISPNETQTTLTNLYNYHILFDIVRNSEGLTNSVTAKSYTNPNDLLIQSEEIEILANEMERCGTNEIDITEKLIPILIDINADRDLIISLKKYNNVSEKMLALSLKYSINKLIKLKKKNEPNFIDSDNLEAYELLNTILSCTYNYDDIFSPLRTQLEIPHIIYIFNYLLEFLNNDQLQLYETPSNVVNFDSDAIVIDWISVLCDSQYQKLIITNDIKLTKILNELKTVVDKYISYVKELKSFLPNLLNLVNGKNLNKKKTFSKWYSIENIKLY